MLRRKRNRGGSKRQGKEWRAEDSLSKNKLNGWIAERHQEIVARAGFGLGIGFEERTSMLLLFEHDFRGLDYGRNGVAYLEAHFNRASLRDHAFNDVVSNLEDDMSHDAAKLEFGDFTFKPVAR
jgi:hypothetical protein